MRRSRLAAERLLAGDPQVGVVVETFTALPPGSLVEIEASSRRR
jgi:hypothetical protein